jgi:predicted nucleic acid-binding protein
LLDTCVLVPNTLYDTLLRLAEDGFYRPLWSERILEELRETLARLYPADPARFDRRVQAMVAAFETATVTGREQVSAGLDLPDPDDRHVLDPAIAGGAQAIVTVNLKDFPADRLAGRGIEAIHPDEFPRPARPEPQPRARDPRPAGGRRCGTRRWTWRGFCGPWSGAPSGASRPTTSS